MRIFMTGASGWIGSAVVPEVQAAGHEVTGIARSDASAIALEAAGVTPMRGSLDDLDVLRAGAEVSDAVIHLGFKHDGNFGESGRAERAALDVFGDVLAGSDRKFLFASGLAGAAPGKLLTERDESPFVTPDSPRGGSEHLALSFAERGVVPVSLRFSPTVHGKGDNGYSTALVRIAREHGASGYIGDGSNHWAAVHRLDTARMIALALEKAPAGTIAHAVAENGITTREIAEAIGRGLGIPAVSVAPEDAAAHFGFLGAFFGMDVMATSEITRESLGWTPREQGLLADIAEYYVTDTAATRAA